MHFPSACVGPLRRIVVAAAAASAVGLAAGHDAKVGDIRIAHPYATPSLAGVPTGAAYLVSLDNGGTVPDKLLQAATPVCAGVEIHTMSVDAQGVMRMRQVDGIALAPKASVKMSPGMGYHLMLVGLKQPLKDGESFPMTLQFERAGKVEVQVVVQAAPAAGGMAAMPMR